MNNISTELVEAFSEIYINQIVIYMNSVGVPIGKATERLRRWREKDNSTKTWSDQRRGLRSYTSPLISTGELETYILDQGINKTFIITKYPDVYTSVVGILPDFPAYNDWKKMVGLVRIHQGGMVVSGIKSFLGKIVPPRPFVSHPSQYNRSTIKFALVDIFKQIFHQLNLKRKV